jgi:hypothetical protein
LAKPGHREGSQLLLVVAGGARERHQGRLGAAIRAQPRLSPARRVDLERPAQGLVRMLDAADPEIQFGVDRLARVAVLAQRELGARRGEPRTFLGDQPRIIAERNRDVDRVLDPRRLSQGLGTAFDLAVWRNEPAGILPL